MSNKEKLVTVRITEVDKNKIKAKAKKIGISLSEFFRLSALNSTIKVVQMEQPIKSEES